jgi:3-oxoacyl-[acyl-carrier protein] reductase
MLALLGVAGASALAPRVQWFAGPQRGLARSALSSLQMAADGPVCIVTGGSRGLGRAIALSLGGEGCRVVVNYAASAGAAEKVVEEIKGLGGDAVAVQADMSSPDGIAALFKATASAFPDPVEVLVNNAGITRDTLVLRMKQAQWEDVINTNLNGVFYASQAGHPRAACAHARLRASSPHTRLPPP